MILPSNAGMACYSVNRRRPVEVPALPGRTNLYLEANGVLSNFEHEELYSRLDDLSTEYHTLEIIARVTMVLL